MEKVIFLGYTWPYNKGRKCMQIEHDKESLKLFLQIQRDGLNLTQSTFVRILSACAILPTLEWGIQIHVKPLEWDWS
jgi:hypothetical protein